MNSTYTTIEIEELFGIPRGRSKEWITRGDIVPSRQKASGRGTKHLFSKNDLYLIILYQKLLDVGINRDMAARVIKRFFRDFGNFELMLKKKLRYLIFTKVAPSGEKPTLEYQLSMEIPKDIPITIEYIVAINLKNVKEYVEKRL